MYSSPLLVQTQGPWTKWTMDGRTMGQIWALGRADGRLDSHPSERGKDGARAEGG